MGYSTPKKQLDLKDFLAQPVTKRPFRNSMVFRRPSTPVVGITTNAETPVTGTKTAKPTV